MFTEVFTNFFLNFGGNWITLLPMFAEGNIEKGLKYLGAGIAGVGVFGASLGQGILGYGACMAIGRNPEVAPKITTTMIIVAGISESGSIYALVVALLLIYAVN